MRAALLAFLCLAGRLAAAPLQTDLVMVELTRWEGHRLVSYKDGVHGWAVGIGHSLTQHGEPVRRLYTATEVRAFFYHDLAVALDTCRAGIDDFDSLPEEVRLVALNVAWGVGPSGFMAFKDLRRSLSRRAWTAATMSLYLSQWFHQVSPARANWAIAVLRAQ